MSFAEKVHNRLLALEGQVQALDKRLKALEAKGADEGGDAREDFRPMSAAGESPAVIKRGPGRPRKIVNEG